MTQPYEFRSAFGEYSKAQEYAEETITLSVSPYEFEMLMSGVATVISDYEGPYEVGDYFKFYDKLKEIKKRNQRDRSFNPHCPLKEEAK